MLTDARLVGRWTTGGSVHVIDPDGWYFNVDGPRTFALSAGDTVLTFGGEQPAIPFTRSFGTGPSLVGVWIRSIIDGPITFTEETTFRSDGSMSSYWTEDGVFESNQSGRYTTSGTMITREERYALVVTGASG